MSDSSIVVYGALIASTVAASVSAYAYYNLTRTLKGIQTIIAKINVLVTPVAKITPIALTATHTVSVTSTSKTCSKCGRRVAKFQIVDGNPICDNCRNGNL